MQRRRPEPASTPEPARRTSTGPHALISAALSLCDLTNRRLLPDFSPIRTQVSVQALPVSHAHHRFRMLRSVPPLRLAPPANGLLAPLGTLATRLACQLMVVNSYYGQAISNSRPRACDNWTRELKAFDLQPVRHKAAALGPGNEGSVLGGRKPEAEDHRGNDDRPGLSDDPHRDRRVS
jgi:hypothetical protein